MDSLHHAVSAILTERRGWPNPAATQLAECAHIVAYEKNAMIFHAGEPTDLIYVLLSGEVKLYYLTADGERLLVGIVPSGEFLGFTDLDAGQPHNAERGQLLSAQALSRCKVAIIAWARVARVLSELPGPDVIRIVRDVREDWVELCGRLLTFLTMNVRRRLEYTIADITAKFGIADARGTLVSLRLSHEDFAELVGASRPMVSKYLKELAAAGVFVKQNGRYILLRPNPLHDLGARERGEETVARVPRADIVKLRARPRRARLPAPAAGRLAAGARI